MKKRDASAIRESRANRVDPRDNTWGTSDPGRSRSLGEIDVSCSPPRGQPATLSPVDDENSPLMVTTNAEGLLLEVLARRKRYNVRANGKSTDISWILIHFAEY